MTASRIFFTTDIHGSKLCFKKFLNAAMFYDANILILGGDISGKGLIPIVDKQDGSYFYIFHNKKSKLKNNHEVNELIKKINHSGFYALVINPKEFEELIFHPNRLDELYKKAVVRMIKMWMAIAEEKLKNSKARCYISPGNDDGFEVDPILSTCTYIQNPSEQVVSIDDQHEMITLGYSNRTPWNSPRELDENILKQKLEKMAYEVKNLSASIFNIHVPPVNTTIDQANPLDKSIDTTSGFKGQTISAGSSACREIIEKFQPMLGIHGHIHESPGILNIGKTVCINPGTAYAQGILRGFLADFEGNKIKSYLFTSG